VRFSLQLVSKCFVSKTNNVQGREENRKEQERGKGRGKGLINAQREKKTAGRKGGG